jgi:hypothetical protein
MNKETMAARLKVAAGPLLIATISVVTMVAFHRGFVLRDARFEHIAAPWQFLTRHLQIWDDTRGPGVPLQYFSPVMGSIQSFFAWIGFPVWLIGRLTLSIYLSIAGIGAWYLWRRLWPERSGWALLAGLLLRSSQFGRQCSPRYVLSSNSTVPEFVSKHSLAGPCPAGTTKPTLAFCRSDVASRFAGASSA